MKKLFLLLLMFCAVGLYAQDYDCYNRARSAGIAFYNNGDYENAEKKFIQAQSCAEIPANNDISKWLEKCANMKVNLSLSAMQAEFEPQGGSTKIEVYTNAKDYTVDMPNWCYIQNKTSKSFEIVAKENTESGERNGDVMVKAGAKKLTVKVIQYGNVRLTSDSKMKEFSNKGGVYTFTIGGNTADWSVSSPDWIVCEKKDGHTLEVRCAANYEQEPRDGSIRVYSGQTDLYINITQKGGDYVNVQSSLSASKDGGQYTIKVTSSSEDWIPTTTESWIQIIGTTADGVIVNVSKNTNTQMRTGRVKISLGDSIGKEIVVRQEPADPVKVAPQPSQPTTKKHNYKAKGFYLGINGGLTIPTMSVSSSSVLSSVMDYGHTDVSSLKNEETPNYKGQTGYHFKLDMHIRLAGKMYLVTGLGYEHFGFENKFESNRLRLILSENYYDLDMKYVEKYSMNYLEVPVKLEVRLPVNDKVAFNLNGGLLVGIGMSAKMDLSGSVYAKHYTNDTYTGYSNSVVSGDVNLFSGDYYIMQRYTTGAASTYYYNGNKANPYKKLNMSLSLGASVELSVVEIGFNYNLGLLNTANSAYWESGDRVCGDLFVGSDRWHSSASISDYKQRISTFELFLGLKF